MPNSTANSKNNRNFSCALSTSLALIRHVSCHFPSVRSRGRLVVRRLAVVSCGTKVQESDAVRAFVASIWKSPSWPCAANLGQRPNGSSRWPQTISAHCPKLDEDHRSFERQNNRWPNLHPKMPDRTISPVKPKDAAERDDGQSCGIVVGRLNLRIWRLLGKLAGLRQKRPTLGGMAVYSRRRSGRLFNVRPDTAALRSNHWAQSRRRSSRYARPAR